jgi:Cu+-exporting ATPase
VARIAAVRPYSEDEVLRLASTLERPSEHPVAAAIVRLAAQRGVRFGSLEKFKSHTGSGVTGIVDGHALAVGNAQLMRDVAVAIPPAEAGSADVGSSELFVARDQAAIGSIFVADAVRSSSREAVQRLRELNVDVLLLSGDRRSAAEAVARETGIDRTVAEVLPEQKVEEIRVLQRAGKVVAMVGDGINDAPALAQADVGISMPKGTDVAIEASDIALMRSDLRGVAMAIALSRRTMDTMKQNLFWAFAYNVVGIPIAAGVLYPWTGLTLSPVIASAAMALSSVSVVTNSLRLRRARLD